MRNFKKAFVGILLFGAILLLFCAFYNNTMSQEHSTDDWIGEYKFFEYIPPTSENHEFAWRYFIHIYKNDTANIVIDGFQTMDRYKSRIVGDENEISLVFEDYLPENVFEPFKNGDLLLRFVKNGKRIDTFWYGIQPNTELDGHMQFKRIVEKITVERFKMQAVKFLKALRENNVKDFSQVIHNEPFYISRIFTRCKSSDERNEDVLSQKIRLNDISSLDFPIGTKNRPSDLNARFRPTRESDTSYEAIIAEAPMKAISIDAFYSVGKSKTELVEQCDSLIKERGLNLGYTIICVNENDFVLASLAGPSLACSDWAYFRKVGDSFRLTSILMFY
jgi:hypothetical protein